MTTPPETDNQADTSTDTSTDTDTDTDTGHPAGHSPWLSRRTVLLVLGALVLQLGFVAGYVGAFHDPTPHAVTIEVAGTGSSQVAEALDGLEGEPLAASTADTAAQAREDVTDGTVTAALVLRPDADSDLLVVASGGGTSLASAVEQVVTAVEADQGRTVTVSDVVPVSDGDARGLSGFYLALGWVVGGYLVASLVGIADGSRARGRRHALVRLAVLVPYALLGGFGGAWVVTDALGVWSGHLLPLGLVGSLTVLAVAAVTLTLQALLGTLGIGAAIALFVILGNPSAGGAYQQPLLPAFFRVLGPWLPNGATTTLVRDTVYFDGPLGGTGGGWGLLVLAGWLVVGAVGSVLLVRRPVGRPTTDAAPLSPAPLPAARA
ncbi:DUF3533 domain-containing protein [Nocardioides bruguierae]|uniref:DUF3533 domain-containing protein n=1 Tax=Nocardioides bruguierae TaxID=2945102 RepID=UPI0020204A40|nr:DUF3533 domain-containing protein [Nocardioides bruguierae]MCL8024296.1 DUF3533 domain-containing protein [Nocardioides bruguierae]